MARRSVRCRRTATFDSTTTSTLLIAWTMHQVRKIRMAPRHGGTAPGFYPSRSRRRRHAVRPGQLMTRVYVWPTSSLLRMVNPAARSAFRSGMFANGARGHPCQGAPEPQRLTAFRNSASLASTRLTSRSVPMRLGLALRRGFACQETDRRQRQCTDQTRDP